MCGPATVPTILACTPKWLSASTSWAAMRSCPAVSGLADSPWDCTSRLGLGSVQGKSGWSVTLSRRRPFGVRASGVGASGVGGSGSGASGGSSGSGSGSRSASLPNRSG